MSDSIKTLIQSFCFLPGIGPKSAQRISYQLLERKKNVALQLAKALQNAVEKTRNCKYCRTLTEDEICEICTNPKRDDTILCIVENPIDIPAIEQTKTYNGLYFCLMGCISPLDGIGPDEIGISILEERLNKNILKEIILATNLTVEGEVTANYIAGLVSNKNIECTRIARGIPMGGELEYIDGHTLARALNERQSISDT